MTETEFTIEVLKSLLALIISVLTSMTALTLVLLQLRKQQFSIYLGKYEKRQTKWLNINDKEVEDIYFIAGKSNYILDDILGHKPRYVICVESKEKLGDVSYWEVPDPRKKQNRERIDEAKITRSEKRDVLRLDIPTNSFYLHAQRKEGRIEIMVEGFLKYKSAKRADEDIIRRWYNEKYGKVVLFMQK